MAALIRRYQRKLGGLRAATEGDFGRDRFFVYLGLAENLVGFDFTTGNLTVLIVTPLASLSEKWILSL